MIGTLAIDGSAVGVWYSQNGTERTGGHPLSPAVPSYVYQIVKYLMKIVYIYNFISPSQHGSISVIKKKK